jgi:hypothetical protein
VALPSNRLLNLFYLKDKLAAPAIPGGHFFSAIPPLGLPPGKLL